MDREHESLSIESAELLARVLRLEEQVGEIGKRVENQQRNLVDLALAVRQLTDTVLSPAARPEADAPAPSPVREAAAQPGMPDVLALMGQGRLAEARELLLELPAAIRQADPTLLPLIDSTLHIQSGNYAAAIAELERARQLGDHPRITQALQMARKMQAGS